MTVRVRQLVRVSSGRVPPIPPVPPTMVFVQQPTDTIVNEPFSPPISVQISDGASDLLILGNFSGTCNLGTQYAVADATGLATFTGFSAGPFTSGDVGCMLSVTNLTRTEVPTIISATFHVLPAPVPVIEIVNDGTAIGAGQSSNGTTLVVSNQINGELLNTTGADFWIFFAATSLVDTERRIRAFAFDDWQNYVFVRPFPDRFSEVCRFFSDYTLPQITGPESGWSVRPPNSPSSTPIDGSAPSSVSFALSGVNPANPITAAATGMSAGPGFDIADFSVQLPSPMIIGRSDCFVISCIVGVIFAVHSAPYPNSFFLPVIAGIAWGIGVSWKFDSDLTENPVWSVNGQLDVTICAVAVTPA